MRTLRVTNGGPERAAKRSLVERANTGLRGLYSKKFKYGVFGVLSQCPLTSHLIVCILEALISAFFQCTDFGTPIFSASKIKKSIPNLVSNVFQLSPGETDEPS